MGNVPYNLIQHVVSTRHLCHIVFLQQIFKVYKMTLDFGTLDFGTLDFVFLSQRIKVC